MRFIKVLLLGILGVIGLTSTMFSYAGNSVCLNGGEKLQATGVCTRDDRHFLNTVKTLNKDGSTHIVKSKEKQSNNKVTRIKFARGAYSAIVTGKQNGFKSEEFYIIRVGKEQTMNIEQIDRKDSQYVSVYITAPNGNNANDMDASCHSQATVSPTIAGDYKIKVVECNKADPWKGRYKLKVTVK